MKCRCTNKQHECILFAWNLRTDIAEGKHVNRKNDFRLSEGRMKCVYHATDVNVDGSHNSYCESNLIWQVRLTYEGNCTATLLRASSCTLHHQLHKTKRRWMFVCGDDKCERHTAPKPMSLGMWIELAWHKLDHMWGEREWTRTNCHVWQNVALGHVKIRPSCENFHTKPASDGTRTHRNSTVMCRDVSAHLSPPLSVSQTTNKRESALFNE